MFSQTRQVAYLSSCLALIMYVSAQSGPPGALSGPASATTADLANDPSGYFHLQVCACSVCCGILPGLQVLYKPDEVGLCRQSLDHRRSTNRHSLSTIRPLCSTSTLPSIQQSSPLLRVRHPQRHCSLHIVLNMYVYTFERRSDDVMQGLCSDPK